VSLPPPTDHRLCVRSVSRRLKPAQGPCVLRVAVCQGRTQARLAQRSVFTALKCVSILCRRLLNLAAPGFRWLWLRLALSAGATAARVIIARGYMLGSSQVRSHLKPCVGCVL